MATMLLAGCGGGGTPTSGATPSFTYTFTPPSSFPTASGTATTEDPTPTPTRPTLTRSPEPTFTPTPTEPEETETETVRSRTPIPTATADPADEGEAVTSALASGQSGYTMLDFLNYVMKDVDQYWSGVWAQAGYREPVVRYTFPAPGETVQRHQLCGGQSDENSADYCSVDDTIAFGQTAATKVWQGALHSNLRAASGQFAGLTGDFSAAYALAHEYSHSLQAELGIVPSPDANGNIPERPYRVYKTELHADCWAGVWANSAYYKGLLEAGDIEEAQRTTLDIGSEADVDLKGHHGSPELRVRAFTNGYNSGVPRDFDPWLQNTYAPTVRTTSRRTRLRFRPSCSTDPARRGVL